MCVYVVPDVLDRRLLNWKIVSNFPQNEPPSVVKPGIVFLIVVSGESVRNDPQNDGFKQIYVSLFGYFF